MIFGDQPRLESRSWLIVSSPKHHGHSLRGEFTGDAQELEREIRRLRDAAADGSGKAMWELGRRYEKGIGVYQDEEIANKWYEKAAEGGYKIAQTYVAAINGDANAAYDLAKKVARGEEIEKDLAFSFRLYLYAAQKGHTEARYEVARCFENGWGVGSDMAKAIEWYLTIGDVKGENVWNKIGFAYKTGKGAVQNHEEALKWFKKSFEKGNAFAEYHIATMYFDGLGGLEKNKEKVIELLLDAEKKIKGDDNSKKLHGEICSMLGKVYYEMKNEEEAYSWYRKCFDVCGDENAEKEAKQMKNIIRHKVLVAERAEESQRRAIRNFRIRWIVILIITGLLLYFTYYVYKEAGINIFTTLLSR